MALDNRRQSIALVLIVVFVAATIGLLWWSTRPIIVSDPLAGQSKKDRKISEDLLSDPRFQELRSRSGAIDIGQKGNPNPFEPFGEQRKPPQKEEETINKSDAATSSALKDCGTDFACLAQAAKTCTPAKASPTSTVDIFGVLQSTTSDMELRGLKGDKCIFYMKHKELVMVFSEPLVKNFLASGKTRDDIAKEEQKLNEDRPIQGKEGTCLFPPDDLAKMLQGWGQGNFSSRDLENRSCSGSLFETSAFYSPSATLKAAVIEEGATERDARRISDVKQIQTALELYFADQGGTYPRGTGLSLGEGVELKLCNKGFTKFGTAASDCTASDTVFMGKVPRDPSMTGGGDSCPPAGNTQVCDYTYTSSSPHTTYTLQFYLENTNDKFKAGANCATLNGIKSGACP